MKSMKLPKFPRDLPDDAEVRDFDLGSGRYARVIMELRKEIHGGAEHFVLHAQAYQMDKSGNFKQAPLGYPSRSPSSTHSVPASAMGTAISLDDGWVQIVGDYDPSNPGDITVVSSVPSAPADKYGSTVWVEKEHKLYRWTEGFADVVARTKVEDLLNVLKTSDLRSGFAFRNRRNQE